MKKHKIVSKHFRKTQKTDLARRMPARAGHWRSQKVDHLNFSGILRVEEYQKNEGGDLWRHSKEKNERSFSKKVSECRKQT